MPKLIVIRGPSGSGKSTVAKVLQQKIPVPTLLIGEDQVRFMFSNWKEADHTASKELALVSILSGLNSGYDVIYEGISNIKTYDQYFQKIFSEHPKDNYFFYLDVSFEEALRRHEERPQKAEFGKDEMKRWLDYASPTKYQSETIIPETSTVEETVDTIMKAAKYVH